MISKPARPARLARLARPIAHPAADAQSAASFADIRPRRDHLRASSPVVYWHLLSLDAPSVAVLWTVFTAAVTQTKLPLATPVTMALTVWTLYASDRLLDSRHLGSTRQASALDDLEPRHFFHHRHRAAFVIAIAIATVALAALLPRLHPAAIRLYLTEGALMTGYFLLIHAAPKSLPLSRGSFFLPSPIPKELLVGPFFAAAIFIPTISRKPELRLELLPLAILFAALCSLNCLYIYAWEHQTGHGSHWTTTYSIRNLNGLTWLFLAASLLCFLSLGRIAPVSFSLRLFPIACAASTLLLAAIHKLRRHFSSLTLRSVADGALLTPLAILPFLFRHQS